MIGLDMLTLIAMNGGTLENVKHVLADMICFFAAGKIGMENRAEEMAKACITGGRKAIMTNEKSMLMIEHRRHC
jgi:hypothetical protein